MKTVVGTFLVSLLIGVMIAGCGSATPEVKATPTASAQRVTVKAAGKIIAEGKVVPVQSASLSLAVGGIVGEVRVKEGDGVQAGQTLMRLAASQQKAAVATAEATVKRAQAARQKLDQPVDENQLIAARADLANAEAALRAAQAAYDRAGGAGNPMVGMLPTSLDLERAANNYQAARARLESLLKGPRAADIAVSEADVAVAQAELNRAKAALADTELRAPFAGAIVTLDAKVGEQVVPSAVIVRLADLSNWEVHTADLTELNVVRIREGDAATLSFDAIADLELTGKVTRIKALGENRQGDIVYTVVIKPDKMDARLRWNMTAKVGIETR